VATRREAMTAKTAKNLSSAAAIALASKLAEEPWDDDNDAGLTVPAPPDYEAQARAVKQTKLTEEGGVALAAPRVPELALPSLEDARRPLAESVRTLRSSRDPELGAPHLRATATSTPAAPAAAPLAASRNPSRVEQSAPPSRPRNSLAELRDLLSLGDYSGALAVAEAHLELVPDQLEAKSARNHCRATLKQMYSARIGNLEATPVLLVPAEQLRWMSIDQRAAFLLHHIDGVSSYETILDICGMPELDALRLLSDLLSQRIIEPR
jgi:hypothetical protein